jgi:uncharacterized protein (UPF0335 family)
MSDLTAAEDGAEIEQVEGVDADSDAHRMLRMFVERIENLDDQIADLRSDRSEVVAEAKANGFDVKALKEVLRRRKLEPDERQSLDALVETYELALGPAGRGVVWGGDLRPQLALPKPKATDRSRRAAEALALAQGADMAGRA